MSDLIRDTTTDVGQALQTLASTLRDTPAFISFERAASNLQNDVEAQNAISAYQSKQQSLQALIMLNALSAEDRTELEQLERAVYTNQTVSAYLEAQNALVALCCAVNDRISDTIGMRFAIRQGGCCG
jgi:cell fate (sporulation/competence/biofilm development) regulator YlbF (YheA/YmcA/DUF963 family)